MTEHNPARRRPRARRGRHIARPEHRAAQQPREDEARTARARTFGDLRPSAHGAAAAGTSTGADATGAAAAASASVEPETQAMAPITSADPAPAASSPDPAPEAPVRRTGRHRGTPLEETAALPVAGAAAATTSPADANAATTAATTTDTTDTASVADTGSTDAWSATTGAAPVAAATSADRPRPVRHDPSRGTADGPVRVPGSDTAGRTGATAASVAGTSAASASPSGASAAAGPVTGTDAAAAARGRRRAETPQGSLPRAMGWTALTTLLPGTGLLSTRMRALGIVLLGVVVLAVIGGGAWYLLTDDPLMRVLGLVTRRPVLIGLLVAAIVVGVVWVLQIGLTNIAHNTKERLRGGRRLASGILALVLVVTAAAPFALGAERLYSAQGLLGNHTVFSGNSDTDTAISSGSDPWKDTPRVNILMLGQDAGADRTGTRPDTIMVASIDTKSGATALFSIPRNLQYVRFPEGSIEAKQFPDGFDAFGKDENLINAVWTWADDNKDLFPGDPNPGLTATRHAVEETLGLKTNYYAMVDLEGFSDLVDAIGGVDINVERKIPIGGGTNQSTGGKYPITGYIEAGQQHLDGYHALWYARSREGSDDNNRMCRQQRMVRIVTEEANPVTLAAAFPQLVTATENNIQTDIPADRLDAFVNLAQRVQKSGFQSYPLTRDIDAPGEDNWGRFGHPNWDYVKQWAQTSIEASAQSTTPTSVKDAPAAEAPASEAPSEAAPTSEAPSADAPTTEAPAPAPDPLKSCLPAGEQG